MSPPLNRGDGEVTEPRIIMRSSICGHHHADDCGGCRSARESNDYRLRMADDTIEALVEALGSLVDQDLQFDGESIVIRCGSHGAAIERARKARSALSLVRRGE